MQAASYLSGGAIRRSSLRWPDSWENTPVLQIERCVAFVIRRRI